MSDAHKRVELIANVAIILIAMLLGGVLLTRLLAGDPNDSAVPAQHRQQLEIGMTFPTAFTDWRQSNRNLVLVLSTTCGFCHQSAEFYNRLTAKASTSEDVKIIAVFPQATFEASEYLAKKGIIADDVISADLNMLNVMGTPTLFLVNEDGIVLDKWVGKLPEHKEVEVMTRVFSDT